MKVIVKDQALNMLPLNPSFESLHFAVPISDITVET